MSSPLKDKVVLITGSSIGIGRATAIRFAEEECNVIVTYYEDAEEAMKTANRCWEVGSPDVLLTNLNVMDDENIRRVVDKIVERHGRIDILINNAGVIVWKRLQDQTIEEIERQIRTNLEGTIKVTRECIPYIRDCIISMSGPTAILGYDTLVPYSATKAGIKAFTSAMAKELKGVGVYTVFPAETATRMTEFHGDSPNLVADVIVTTAKGDYDIESGDDVKVWDLPSTRERSEMRAHLMRSESLS